MPVNVEEIVVAPEEAAPLVGIRRAKFFQLMKRAEYRPALVKLPGVAGTKVHVARLRKLIDKFADEQNGPL